METLAWICLFAPLAGVVALTLAGSLVGRAAAAWVGVACSAASFAAAVAVAVHLLGNGSSHRTFTYTLYTWAGSAAFKVPLGVLIDPLSAAEMLVVAGISTLIILYSVGYMHGDEKQRRFFVYLDLFVFSMLLLVMADNFVLLLAGWGMVGLSSYLLIGYWHEREAPVAAAKKAFVMNAVGDVGIAVAVFMMARDLGTTNFQTVFATASSHWAKGSADANWVAFLLLVGAVAKSAQVPLHTWLPDAMEGPTPVSALIHAATMVTAGVYLIARTHVLFANAPSIRDLVAVLGLVTLLMAGVIALVQTDIKKIIAYSTMSQIGYMFTAVGVGADSAGMYHLVAHAFFKALLFLGAGIVIHALASEQDVRRMGGLARAMPKTAALMWVGSIALIGIWPTSKDAILAGALHNGGGYAAVVWAGGLLGALFTGIYTTRLMRLVFYGERSQFASEHLHTDHGEAPWTMLWPVAALAVGTLVVGALAVGFGTTDHLAEWLRSATPAIEPTSSQDLLTTGLAWLAGIGGAVLTWRVYASPQRLAATTAPFRTLAAAAERKFYWDDLYDRGVHRLAAGLADGLYRYIERLVIWGSMLVVTAVVGTVSRLDPVARSGLVRLYAATMVTGAAALGVFFLARAHL
ncbi:MAG TPA: NADH-quinone oxidoreductase subunit L [Gaiellales bacterium]|nr:NADH-quinone oxidoreductase subunit L [Gaiellales bacterium]